MDTITIGKELKGLRAKNGHSRKAVCKSITSVKINPNSLRLYEKDVKNCPTGKLLALLEFYNEQPSIFFNRLCANKHNG